MTPSLETRLTALLDGQPATPEEVEYLLAAGYAKALRLDGERLALARRIDVLASNADLPRAAEELQAAWARHRVLHGELHELRDLLERVRSERHRALA
jgi:hypothetical protein